MSSLAKSKMDYKRVTHLHTEYISKAKKWWTQWLVVFRNVIYISAGNVLNANLPRLMSESDPGEA